MAWYSRIQRLFNRRRRADPRDQERFVLPYPASGVRLTADEALCLSTVWACIDAIAKSIASCRWNIIQPLGGGKRRLLDDDPLFWVLNTRANADMTAIGFREAMAYTAIPFGNAYAEIVKSGGGKVAELWPLEHDRVTPRRRDEAGGWSLYYEYRQVDGTIAELAPEQVLHIRGPGLNGLLGDNIVSRAAKSLSVAAAQERFSASFFGQGAQPTGVLRFPGTLSEEMYKRLKEDWATKRQGPENAHRPLILEGGMDWRETSVDPQKSQLVEARYLSVEEICRWFGVPPHKVQHLLRATFSNIEHSSIEFVRDALTPWARRFEQEADFKLFRQDRAPWKHTIIDTAPLSYGDAYSRAQAHAIWRQNGVMTANEIRAREGLNDTGTDGDVLLVQKNMATIDQIVNPPVPVAPPAPAPQPPPGGNGQDGGGDSGSAVAALQQAVTTMVAGALERYVGRLANTRDDRERARQRLWLVSECEAFSPFAVKAHGRPLSAAAALEAAGLVETGVPPATAAEAVLSTSGGRLAA